LKADLLLNTIYLVECW